LFVSPDFVFFESQNPPSLVLPLFIIQFHIDSAPQTLCLLHEVVEV
jgi:hypothetical protein